jgi:Asp-tRNA(Asn)/Glu-tRNA(Gln) amidotransferase C subunit
MILQQIRHSKLWFAAAAGNWELADHELEELQEGFEDVAALFPKLQEVDVAPVIAALNAGEIAALDNAVAAQDRVQFVIAYDKLTAACNACHQVTKHAFIVIQQPLSPPFNNQSFTPGPPDPMGGGAHRH